MTPNETAKFLNKIAALFPIFQPDEAARDTWGPLFCNFTAGEMDAALQRCVKTRQKNGKSKGLAPTPDELYALLPGRADTTDEQITWNSTGTEYTIRRGGECRTYTCASPEEKKAYKAEMERRGYREVGEMRARGYAVFYAPVAWG